MQCEWQNFNSFDNMNSPTGRIVRIGDAAQGSGYAAISTAMVFIPGENLTDVGEIVPAPGFPTEDRHKLLLEDRDQLLQQTEELQSRAIRAEAIAEEMYKAAAEWEEQAKNLQEENNRYKHLFGGRSASELSGYILECSKARDDAEERAKKAEGILQSFNQWLNSQVGLPEDPYGEALLDVSTKFDSMLRGER